MKINWYVFHGWFTKTNLNNVPALKYNHLTGLII